MGKVSFIHLSDIHFIKTSGNPADIDQDLRDAIITDIKMNAKYRLGKINGILVSGDIAYCGIKEEYKKAQNFLGQITDIFEIERSAVYCVPGNHDVNQNIPRRSNHVYESQCKLDSAITLDEVDKIFESKINDQYYNDVLFKPILEYNEFASKFECNIDANKLNWNQKFPLSYGMEILKSIQAYIDVDNQSNWLRTIARITTRHSHYPTQHLLLLQFLGLSIEDICNKYKELENNKRLYPCLNKVCEKYLKLNISIWKRKSNTHGKYYYSFKCQKCGFMYARYDLSKINNYDFIIDYGHLWRDKLKALHKQGLSYRQVGRILGISHPTVKKQLNICTSNLSNTTLSSSLKVPIYKTDYSCKPPKDWNDIDKKIAKELYLALFTLTDNKAIYKSTVRISKELLCKKIDKRSYISHNISRLPITKRFLDTHAETIEQFYKRKIDNCYLNLINDYSKITVPILLFNAHVKKHYQKTMEEYIINKYNI